RGKGSRESKGKEGTRGDEHKRIGSGKYNRGQDSNMRNDRGRGVTTRIEACHSSKMRYRTMSSGKRSKEA
ncbi:hypothetical protein DOS67_03590, partial [Staphylococcus felis]